MLTIKIKKKKKKKKKTDGSLMMPFQLNEGMIENSGRR